MEVMKPEVKQKPKPPKPIPKPRELNRNDPEKLEKSTPLVPQRPTDSELSHTQYRVKRAVKAHNEANGNLIQKERKEKLSETPVVPTKPTEKELNATTRYSHRRREQSEDTQSSKGKEQPEESRDEADFKQEKQSGFSGLFKRSQKEKPPTFTTYIMHDFNEEEKTEEAPAKQAPTSKQGGLKEIMKGLQIKSSPKTSRESSPEQSAEEPDPEKDQAAEKNKQEKNAEPKQDIGALFTGMFRKNPKERSVSPSLMVSKADSDAEETEEAEKTSEQSNEKGSFFSGMRKKPAKTEDKENLNTQKELSASNDSLSENKEKGGIFSGMFRKSPKPTEADQKDEDQKSLRDELSGSNDNLSENSKQEKGSVFSSMFKKSPKPSEGPRLAEGAEPLQGELSASTDSLTENKEKGGLFSGLLKKTPKTTGEENLSAQKDLSASNDSLSESTKEKGVGFSGLFKKPSKPADAALTEEEKGVGFSGLFKKPTKPADSASSEEEKQLKDKELSGSNESLSENRNKEKGGRFGGIFKKASKPAETAQSEEDESPDKELSASNENLSENKQERGGGLFSGLLKKTPKPSGEREDSPEREAQKELSASNDDLSEGNTTKEKNIFSNMFKKPQKPAEGATADKDLDGKSDKQLSGSSENLSDTTVPKEKKGGLGGIFKRSASIENLFDEEKGGLFSGLRKKTPKSGEDGAVEDKDEQKDLSGSTDSLSENGSTKEKSFFSGMFKKTPKASDGNITDEDLDQGEDRKLSTSCENLLEASTTKEKSGGLAGIFKKSPKPSPRTIAAKDPLSKELSASCDSLPGAAEDELGELSASNENLLATGQKERKGGFAGRFRRNKTIEHQDSEDVEAPEGGGLRRRRTIKKKQRVTSFRVKKTLPKIPKRNAQDSEKMPMIEETVEMQDLNQAQESSVEVQNVEMAAYPTEANPLEAQEENDELMEWWNTVKSWSEWNETSNFQEEDAEQAMEQAADRVYMAARLFVRLFNQRGASLQQRILELLALADAADQFHKKTVSVAVGGGVASVCGSVATITGLILAPFTFGASIIVTAVGIGVATAGSITSATANITDTVHSNMDRKKLEKMIQGYQEEIKDIREIMEFVQAGMDTLQEWDFEKYSESAAKKALNHNLKHVMKEGGRAGKALMINTDKLISTVQVLGAAGGAAKAAQAISVTTGVMSALFLALDVFFLAKDSHELRKGAKTKFARKIRDVCKELQDGLLELNKVKTQLQKTMDGIEVEEYEEIEEVEVEVDDEYESDPKKLAELEQELDLMEEKLDKKVEEENKRLKEIEMEKEREKEREKENLKSKKEKGEKSMKEKEVEELEMEKISDEKKEKKEEEVIEEGKKTELQKGKKKEKETENWYAAAKEKLAAVIDKEKYKTGKEGEENKSKSGDPKGEDQVEKVLSEKNKAGRESERSRSSKEEEKEVKPEWKSVNKDREGEGGGTSTRRHSSKSEKEEEKEVKPEWKSVTKERETEGGSATRRHSSRSDREGPHWRDRASKHDSDSNSVSGHVKHITESWRRTEEERGVKDWRAEVAKGKEEKKERESKREEHGKSDVKRESHRSHETASSRREHSEKEWMSSREHDSKRSHHRRGSDELRERGDEKRGSRIESARRKFERAEGEERDKDEQRVRRREDRERRGSDRDREHRHSHRGSRSRANALLEDGLNI